MTCTATEFYKTLPLLIDLENKASAGQDAVALIGTTLVTVKTTHEGRRHQFRINGKVASLAACVAAINDAFDAIEPTDAAAVETMKTEQRATIRAKWTAAMDNATANMQRTNAHQAARKALEAINGTTMDDAAAMVYDWRQERTQARNAAILAKSREAQDAANVRADDFTVVYTDEGQTVTRATITDAQGNTYTATGAPLVGSSEDPKAYALRMALEQVPGITRAQAYEARDYVRPARPSAEDRRADAIDAAAGAYHEDMAHATDKHERAAAWHRATIELQRAGLTRDEAQARANDWHQACTGEAAPAPILASYTDPAAHVTAQVIEQAGRYLVRLIDDDSATTVGVKSYPDQASADAYARRCATY